MKNILIIGAFIIVGLIVVLIVASPQAEESINIRIKNSTSKDIENFWLGAGGTGNSTESYGSIKNGEETRYKSFKPVLANYRKMNFITTDKKQYTDVIYPEKFFDKNELEKGRYYTFKYTITNETAVLTITQDK